MLTMTLPRTQRKEATFSGHVVPSLIRKYCRRYIACGIREMLSGTCDVEHEGENDNQPEHLTHLGKTKTTSFFN